MAFNLDEFTELESESIFKLESQPLLSYEKDYDTQVDITVEMNLDQVVIARAGYTVLDWISDIGGMQGMLISFIAWLIAIWNHNMFDNHMVTRLYKIQKHQDASNADKQSKLSDRSASEFMFPRKLFNPKEYLKSLCCCQRLCHTTDRLERGFELGRSMLEKETNIIEIVKSRRYLSQAVRLLLSKEQRKKLRERSRYLIVNPDKLKCQTEKYTEPDWSASSDDSSH